MLKCIGSGVIELKIVNCTAVVKEIEKVPTFLVSKSCLVSRHLSFTSVANFENLLQKTQQNYFYILIVQSFCSTYSTADDFPDF